jgi:hypothetical protein
MKPAFVFVSGVTVGVVLGTLTHMWFELDYERTAGAEAVLASQPFFPSVASGSERPSESGAESQRAAVAPVAEDTSSHALEPVLLRDGFAALEDALGHHPPWTGDVAALEAKYAGLSDVEKIIADFALQKKLEAERKRIGEELLRSGEFEVHDLGSGEPSVTMATSPGEPMRSFGWAYENTPTGLLMKIAAIKPDRFPEFHALQMECWWLGTHLRHEGILERVAGVVQTR